MTQQPAGPRLTAILWFVAAGLAFLAVGIRYISNRTINWGAGAGGLFFLVMGVSAWQRSRPRPPGA